MTAIRRLATIRAGDVAGYSRQMGADKQGTLTRLKAIRSELIDPEIAAHQGRIIALDPRTRPPATVCWSNSPAPSPVT
jgi:class 3 adenylate cyclase